MEKKTETKLRMCFSAFGKTRKDGGSPCDAHDAGAAFMTPPPYFNMESARDFPGPWHGFSFSSWF